MVVAGAGPVVTEVSRRRGLALATFRALRLVPNRGSAYTSLVGLGLLNPSRVTGRPILRSCGEGGGSGGPSGVIRDRRSFCPASLAPRPVRAMSGKDSRCRWTGASRSRDERILGQISTVASVGRCCQRARARRPSPRGFASSCAAPPGPTKRRRWTSGQPSDPLVVFPLVKLGASTALSCSYH
jgi:hypothetical protein